MKHLLIIASLLILALACTFSSSKESSNKEIHKDVKFKKIESAVIVAGSLYRVDSFPSQFIKARPVDVWLPENYSNNKKYNVLYMHDGQMLFDSTTTWNKQEWKVDEWATQLMKEGKTKDFIVVGIHNIPQIRWQDLFPEKAMNFMDKLKKDSLEVMAQKSNFNIDFKGDEYLRFLVEELKPVIDEQYSVYTDKAHTFVAGSSMGGLMSMYAISEYPNVFSGAACISTHWPGGSPMPNNPFPDAIFDYMEANLASADDHKLYFDYGNKTLDKYYPEYAPKVDKLLKEKGYTEENSRNLFFEGTDHSESSWNKRLDIPLTFLLAQ